ncbi:MAG TPA: glucokinase [Campylobacterales bacterium]|nr:glucokinase [Campylobacterales bacterium]
MILAGDIGGTKTNLALFQIEDRRLSILKQRQFPSADYTSLMEVIEAFAREVSLSEVEAACFGIAGPVIEGRCRTTNLAWEIRTDALQPYLATQRVRLLNDLESTAYGMLYLEDEAFVTLNAGKSTQANRAVIAAGTGLGEAILYYDPTTGFHPIASEGGHCDVAPLTEQHDQLLAWLRQRYPEHVSYERILSGPGVYALYQFLAESGFAAEPEAMQQLSKGQDKSAMVSRCAIEANDPLCQEALRLFVEIYGAEAGNLALKSMALGGLYIGGGIAPKILSVLQEGTFMRAFVAKGRFEEMLKAIEVKVSLNDETALLGAAYFARDKLLQ